MIRSKQEPSSGDKLVGFVEWVNSKLRPALGPATLGPYDDDGVERFGPCPICGGVMGAHMIDRSAADHVLLCPNGMRTPAADAAVVRWSMLGMPSRRAERVRPVRP